MRLVHIACIALLLTACERDRMELTRGRVMALADQFCTGQQLAWGPVDEAWPPLQGHPIYGDWWQVDYHGPSQDGQPTVVLVDADSGWARRPWPGYPLRVALPAAGSSAAAPSDPSTWVRPGRWILALAHNAEAAALDIRIANLNNTARVDRLPPLFSRRAPRHGPVQLIYGWDGTSGIRRDGRISAWMAEHTTVGDSVWIDLGNEPTPVAPE